MSLWLWWVLAGFGTGLAARRVRRRIARRWQRDFEQVTR